MSDDSKNSLFDVSAYGFFIYNFTIPNERGEKKNHFPDAKKNQYSRYRANAAKVRARSIDYASDGRNFDFCSYVQSAHHRGLIDILMGKMNYHLRSERRYVDLSLLLSVIIHLLLSPKAI